MSQHQRKAGEHRAHRGHHDRPEAQQARLEDRRLRIETPLALGGKREIDHHDAVLLDDAYEQDDPDQGDDAEIVTEQDEDQECAHARRRQRR